jgi:hypothetical protein
MESNSFRAKNAKGKQAELTEAEPEPVQIWEIHQARHFRYMG